MLTYEAYNKTVKNSGMMPTVILGDLPEHGKCYVALDLVSKNGVRNLICKGHDSKLIQIPLDTEAAKCYRFCNESEIDFENSMQMSFFDMYESLVDTDLSVQERTVMADVLSHFLSVDAVRNVMAKKQEEKQGSLSVRDTTEKGGTISKVKKKESKMSKVSEIVKSSVAHGAKVAAADEAGNVVLDIAGGFLADVPAAKVALESEAGRQVAKVVVATALLQMVESNVIADENGNISSALSMVVEAASRDFIQPKLAKLTPQLGQLARLGVTK